MQVSDHFQIREFVSGLIWATWKDSSHWFVQRHLIELAESIRVHFDKPMIINNWHTGGRFNYRGFRDDFYYYNPNGTVKKTSGHLSQHRFGNAIDFNIVGIDCDDIRSEIIANSGKFMALKLTTLEHQDYAPTWVHADCRYTGLDKIKIVKP